MTNLAVPQQHVRRRSYSGSFTGQDEGPRQRRPSAEHYLSKDRFGFNPLIQKLSNKIVLEVIIGLVLVLLIVLILSLYRLLT